MVKEAVFSLLSFLPQKLLFVVDVEKEEEFERLLLLLLLMLLFLLFRWVIDDVVDEEEHDDEEDADEGLHIVDRGGDSGG